MDGTDANGARSDKVETFRASAGRFARVFEGEEERMCVDEVGTGVGYLVFSSKSPRVRFRGRGSAGDEKGSKAGRSAEVAFLAAGVGEAASSRPVGGADMTRICSSPDRRVRAGCVAAIPAGLRERAECSTMECTSSVK